MKKLLIVVGVMVVLIACNKDKYTTTPQIKIKSFSGSVVPKGSAFSVTFEFTDKEGDLDDSLFVRKYRLNKRVAPSTIRDSIKYKIPDYPTNDHGEMTITIEYNSIVSDANPPSNGSGGLISDTLAIWFKVTDKAKHVSDSVSPGTIIVLR